MKKSKKKKAAAVNKMALAQRARRAREKKMGHLGTKLKKKSKAIELGITFQEAVLNRKKPTGPNADTVNQMVADLNKVPVSDVVYETPTDVFLTALRNEAESLALRLEQINALIDSYK